MDDVDILQRIHALVDEEHELERSGRGLSEGDRVRRDDIERALDQCWDLLRQRRARRAAADDPDAAAVRDERTVEGYQQ